MKRSKRRTALTITLLLLIYAAGLIAGLRVITYVPSSWRRADLEYYANQRLIEYQSNSTVYSWQHSGMAAVIYDKDGKFENFFRMNGNVFSINFVDQTEDDIPAVLSGNKTLRTFPLVKNLSKSGYTTFIYVGLPMYDDEGNISGAFFWVKEAEDLVAIMVGYIIIFSIMFAIISALLIFISFTHRRNDRIQRQYVDNITHDLKSPITAISALTMALSDGVPKTEDEVNVYYGMILGEANRQNRMIHESLDLSRIQTGSQKPPMQYIDPQEAFAELFEKYDLHCDLIGVSFTVDDSFKKIDKLYTNTEYISQVFDTLLGNSIKFVSEGDSITISVPKETRRRITVCVEDTGSGIGKEDLPHIFERFYKADKSDSNDQGSGLGLAIAKASLDSMGEKIRIESEKGKGTRALFTIKKKAGLFAK